jgi:drug/metabolite transporter (DMT)-like permease
MEKLKILILAGIGLIISIIGLTMAVDKNKTGYVLLSIGALILFIFYIITFRRMLRSPSVNPKRRVLWTTAIIMLPVIANIVYVIMHDAFLHPEIPKDRF